MGSRLRPGGPGPPGATVTGEGVDFALWAPAAEAVTLCLFDDAGTAETARLPLPACTDGTWHGRLEGAGPGLVYGFRLRAAQTGAERLVLDPAARELVVAGQAGGAPAGPAAEIPYRARVKSLGRPASRPPRRAWRETVIYELHVKGFTARHPGVPGPDRGTFRGLGCPVVVDHLRSLGVTAVELLPVQAFIDEPFLQARGLTNFWGYNPLAWSAPHPAYGSPEELRDAVDALHDAGIEVILDVVYNHTAEGGRDGPALHLKLLDRAGYYWLDPGEPARHVDHTGCGNTVRAAAPPAAALVIDSLCHWVEAIGIDGFRFDLATVLGRAEDGFRADAPLLAALEAEPRLEGVKLVAEPWDVGPEGYRLGGFPACFSEWNDRFRDEVRGYWLGGATPAGALARRLAGSADVFRGSGRSAAAGINFVTCHDGFTLLDAVSYARKRNQANGEDDRDGHRDNRSWNAGVEGPSADPVIARRRRTLRLSLLGTLACAQGVPMLCAGDELGRTQGGNNNAYCQDNETSWLDWATADLAFCEAVRRLLGLRRKHAVLAAVAWLDEGDPQLAWLGPDGAPMTVERWESLEARAFVMERRAAGDRALRVLFNPGSAAEVFALDTGREWVCRFDSARADPTARVHCDGAVYLLPAHGMAILEET